MRFFERVLRLLLILVVILIFIEVTVEVASRFIFHIPIPWGAEVSQTLLVWMTFIGSAAAFLRGGHISVELFLERMSRRWRPLMNRLNVLIILTFLACGIASGFKVVSRVWNDVTASLGISAGVLYLSLPVGFALMAVFGLWMLFTGRDRLGGEEERS